MYGIKSGLKASYLNSNIHIFKSLVLASKPQCLPRSLWSKVVCPCDCDIRDSDVMLGGILEVVYEASLAAPASFLYVYLMSFQIKITHTIVLLEMIFCCAKSHPEVKTPMMSFDELIDLLPPTTWHELGVHNRPIFNDIFKLWPQNNYAKYP